MNMDATAIDNHRAADAELNRALEAHTDADRARNSELRLKLIDEYEEACQSRDDPFEAMLGASTAEIERLKNGLLTALRKEFEKRPECETFIEYKTQINQVLKMHDAAKFDYLVVQQRKNESQQSRRLKSRVPLLPVKPSH
jgi:dsRNA-specific ribonuclease